MMADGGQAFKVKVTAAVTIIRKVKVSPSVYLAMLRRGKLKWLNIPYGV
jgi:hypothetical protein